MLMILMWMFMMRMMATMVMAMMMMMMLLLLLLDAAVAGRSLGADHRMLRSTCRATIRQHEALGPVVQHAGGVPVAGLGGGAFKGSDDATADLILASDLTIARPISGLDRRRDRGRLGPLVN